MKQSQRLDCAQLAGVLGERGLCEPQALREALQLSQRGHAPFADALVNASLVQDWELSRTVCELYGLPFLPVDMCEPDPKAREGIDSHFLIEHGLVPIGRFGNVLTIAMPAIVPADVLGMLAAMTDLQIIPIVGTVRTNRRWIEMNLQADLQAALPKVNDGEVTHATNEWGALFDQADAAVLLDLTKPEDS